MQQQQDMLNNQQALAAQQEAQAEAQKDAAQARANEQALENMRRMKRQGSVFAQDPSGYGIGNNNQSSTLG